MLKKLSALTISLSCGPVVWIYDLVFVISPQKKEYYYTDTEIRDDFIRKLEQEAIQLASLSVTVHQT